MHLTVNCPRNSSMALKFKQTKRFLCYWSKQHFDCFDLYLKTTWPTKISMPFFEFLGQFVLRCICYFSKKSVDNFEIEHKTCWFWLGMQFPIMVYWKTIEDWNQGRNVSQWRSSMHRSHQKRGSDVALRHVRKCPQCFIINNIPYFPAAVYSIVFTFLIPWWLASCNRKHLSRVQSFFSRDYIADMRIGRTVVLLFVFKWRSPVQTSKDFCWD